MKNDKFKTADEILEQRKNREREESKERLVKDAKGILTEIFPQREMKKIKKKFSILKWMGILLLFLFLITMMLGLIFLLKFFIKGIF